MARGESELIIQLRNGPISLLLFQISPDTVRDPTVDALDLSAFQDIHRFRVEGSGESVALFLLGRTTDGWGGLASVATWT